jgi:hypothetical protein
MRPAQLTITGVESSDPLVLDTLKNPFQVGFGCQVTGTIDYTVQHSFADPNQSGGIPAGSWFDHPSVAGATDNQDGTYAFPVRAIRLQGNSGTGTVTMDVIQAGH